MQKKIRKLKYICSYYPSLDLLSLLHIPKLTIQEVEHTYRAEHAVGLQWLDYIFD